MPYASAADGVRLYYEEAGHGLPIVFVHEFSGDFRSWEAQVRYFSRRYRCIAFNARGYPPSDVPRDVSSYSQKNAVEDVASVMRACGVAKAHVMGCSMGAQTTLQFGLTYPAMAMTLTAIGAGSGAAAASPAEQRASAAENARRYEHEGLAAMLDRVRVAPNRVRLARKNPRAWDDFCRRFMEHSAEGCAYTQRGIQGERPPIATLEAKLRELRVPLHVVAGDEDPGALDAAVFVKRVCPAARITIAPATGHLVNVEEPELLNRLTEQFYLEAESLG